MKKTLTTILILFSSFIFTFALEQNNQKSHAVQLKSLILPTSLIIAGSIPLLWDTNDFKIGTNIVNEMQDWSHGHQIKADTYLRHLPAFANIGIANLGASSKYNFNERLLTTATSYIITSGIVKVLKICINNERPDHSDYDSFPSGHTAIAFMGAELMRQTYDNVAYGIAAYGFATGIAFCRLYNNKHWINDVIAGAGCGILSAKIAFWLLPLEKRIFKLGKNKNYSSKDKNSFIAFAPYYEHHTNAMGFGLVAVF